MKRLRQLSVYILVCSTTLSFGQLPDHLVYDIDQSQHFGAENIITVHRMLYKQQDSLIPAKLWEEDNFLRKSAGIGYRALKLGLLDLQVDYLATLTQHEVFGHGSRFREFGYTKSSYNLNLPFPFGSGSGFARSGIAEPGRKYTRYERMAIVFGGNEGNIVLSGTIVPRVLSKNRMHYREALLYLLSKNNLVAYIWADKFKQQGTFGGGDMATYVLDINILNASSGKHYTLDKLAMQSLVSFLNPVQLYSVFAIGKTYLLDGNEAMKNIPAITVKEVRYLPAIGYNLTPFGSEFILDQYFFSGKRLFHLGASLGDPTFHKFWGGGLKIYNLVGTPNLLLSTDAKLWHQPSMELGGKVVENTSPGLGFQFKTDVSYFPFKKAGTFGLYAQLGYKTDGYVIGEQLNNGVILRFGASLRAN